MKKLTLILIQPAPHISRFTPAGKSRLGIPSIIFAAPGDISQIFRKTGISTSVESAFLQDGFTNAQALYTA